MGLLLDWSCGHSAKYHFVLCCPVQPVTKLSNLAKYFNYAFHNVFKRETCYCGITACFDINVMFNDMYSRVYFCVCLY